MLEEVAGVEGTKGIRLVFDDFRDGSGGGTRGF